MDKSTLRHTIAQQKRALTEAQIDTASRELARLLFAHPLYLRANALYAYLSYNQEVRTAPIIRRAMADGKRVAVPKVFGQEMRFIWLDSLNDVAPGYRGIPEPTRGETADAPDALMLMPGLAFTADGARLGYGGGFYDRFLEAEPHPTVALCYAFQLVPSLPVQAHDKPVDAVLSVPISEVPHED